MKQSLSYQLANDMIILDALCVVLQGKGVRRQGLWGQGGPKIGYFPPQAIWITFILYKNKNKMCAEVTKSIFF